MSFFRILLTSACILALVVCISTPASAQVSTSLAFQGFEKNTGDWTPTIVSVPAGGGTLHLPAASGSRYAELTNVPDSYGTPGYGGAQYSYFGFNKSQPYPGNFSQSISMYIDKDWHQ